MDTLTVDYLADHPEFVPPLAEWLHNQWGSINPGETPAIRVEKVKRHMNRDKLPLAVVAFRGNAPLGTASLIENDMETRPDLTPWLASVLVTPSARRQGVGAALVRRIVAEAGRMGYPRLYLWTDHEEKFYTELGWTLDFRGEFLGLKVSVMHCDPV